MAFTLRGGNAARNDYDYQSGSGLDSFMSRSIDEVSWETSLGATYTSLSSTPIGAPSTAINYDTAQLSGSQGDTTTLGGGGTSGSGNLQIDAGNNRITLSDGTNTRLLLGQDKGGF